MAPVGKIYFTSKQHFNTAPAFAVAKYNGLELEEQVISLEKREHKSEAFLAKFPFGRIPAFEGPDGFTLTEGIAIARYLASLNQQNAAKLLGADPKTSAKIEQWISFAHDEIAGRLVRLFHMLVAHNEPYNKALEQSLVSGLEEALSVLDAHLKKNTFLVGHRITLADLITAGTLYMGFVKILGKEQRAKVPNVVRFFETVVNQPTVLDVWGKFNYNEEFLKYVAPKKEEKAKAPKQAEPKPKKEVQREDVEDEPAVPAEPKAKNPLDSLPKSPLVLDEWKRVYSNKDTRSEALPWLWEHWDAEGYSFWRVDFKYNEELTQVFMSANQVGGFFNRLEASRKYIMGTMGVFGEANNSVISGAFICRGKDWKPVFEVAPDYESYDITPLDEKKAEDKKFIEDVFAWEAVIDGKSWADGKIMK